MQGLLNGWKSGFLDNSDLQTIDYNNDANITDLKIVDYNNDNIDKTNLKKCKSQEIMLVSWCRGDLSFQ